jgi:hypothetical protein
MNEAETLELLQTCSNEGRWGADDELGTLNYITGAKRVAAAGLVRSGEMVSLAFDLTTAASDDGTQPLLHLMMFQEYGPVSVLDYVGFAPHRSGLTHVDGLTHVFFEGRAYNGRWAVDITHAAGMSFGSVHAQRGGIFTRAVLLDVAAARGVPWLEATDLVTADDFDRAETQSGTAVDSGDAVVVQTGAEAREAAMGPPESGRRVGLDANCLLWMHRREVALYTGDCGEKVPFQGRRVTIPLHQIGSVAMGLILLDGPRLSDLLSTCRRLNRFEFALAVAPLPIVGGTGCPVNPLALF